MKFSPRAEHLHRAHDQGGSIRAASDAVESGRAAAESVAVLEALRRFPESTSAELAARAPEIGRKIGQDPTAWRTTCARRLPGLEDRGAVRATVPSFDLHRPFRDIDPELPPCTASKRAGRCIRWRAV